MTDIPVPNVTIRLLQQPPAAGDVTKGELDAVARVVLEALRTGPASEEADVWVQRLRWRFGARERARQAALATQSDT